MARVVITIYPSLSDERLLGVADAMQQVLDSMQLFEDAQVALNPRTSFAWKLEKASTNSPFTVVALAQPLIPSHFIEDEVQEVKEEVAKGIRNLIATGSSASWMTQGSLAVARNIFVRTKNGIGETDIDLEGGNVISIRQEQAEAGIKAIAGINIMMLDQEIPARQSFGEIDGIMVAVGRYRGRPAVQIRTELYGFIWCSLPKHITEQFGSQHSMAEVWEGKTLGVQGRLNYAVGGSKITNIDATDVREIVDAPRLDLASVLDPNFTAGMDPIEYLDKLHEGELG
jgi:hypothetical protein